jgi:hypothetical protein
MISLAQIEFLSVNFGRKYAMIKNGVATHALSGELISSEHLRTDFKELKKPDGIYDLGEATCDGALPLLNGGKAEPTEENKLKYQCKIGRHAPECEMYNRNKCAIYSLTHFDKYELHAKPSELIKMFNI